MSKAELGYLIIGIGVGAGSVLIIIGVIEILASIYIMGQGKKVLYQITRA